MQNIGIGALYRHNDHVRSMGRQLMALPLLPGQGTENAFDELVSAPSSELSPLVDYFRSFWLRQTPAELCKVSDLDMRTNNQCDDAVS